MTAALVLYFSGDGGSDEYETQKTFGISDDNPAAAAAVYEAYEYSLELLKTTRDMGRLYRSADPRLAHIRVLSIHRRWGKLKIP